MKITQRGVAALIAGMLTASCSGHAGGGPILPQSSNGAQQKASAAVPAGWSSTATQAMSVNGASDLGALSASTPLTVRVGLQTRNAKQLDQVIATNQTISEAAYMAQYAPTSAQVASVVSYLQSAGFSNVKADPDNLLVSADGTAAIANKAFNTNLESFSVNGAKLYANTSAALVPQSLSGVAVAVLGLNNVAQMVKPQCTQGQFGLPCLGSTPLGPLLAALNNFDASTIRQVYDAGATSDGSQTTIGVMAWGDVSGVVPDLRYAEQQQNMPQVPVQIIASGLVPSNGGGGGGSEWDLDTQSSTGIAGNVKGLYLYTTTAADDADIVVMFNRWANDDLAQLANSSFGECEYGPYVDGTMLVADQIFAYAASHGQTMFVSTGDSGSNCSVGAPNGVPAGAPMVEWPASSPYTVGVGGTTLFPNSDGTYGGEQSWNAGGGGMSLFEYQPYWEVGVQPASTSTTSALGVARGVPDVAMLSGLSAGAGLSGYTVYYTPASSGGFLGTSLASPLAMGAYARMMSAHNNALGYAPPRLYALYNENPTAGAAAGTPPTEPRGGFHDILTGSNGSYTALPGYDYTTGLGSIDISVMNALIGR